MAKIKVLLADDHTVVRQGLRILLESQDDIEVVAEAGNGREAVQLARKLQPDVIVLDLAMPLLNGMEATRQLQREAPHCKVLVLSTYCDDDCVERVIEAGAVGYLVKQTAADELLKAIRESAKGNAYFSSCMSRRLLAKCREVLTPGARKSSTRLTAREYEVLQLIAEGQANKQIAAELQISIKTVEKHRQQVMNKLNIHDIAGLTRHAVAKGMVRAQVGSV